MSDSSSYDMSQKIQKKRSLYKRVLASIVISQILIFVFSIYFINLYLETLEKKHYEYLDNFTQQIYGTIEKNLSYGNYNAVNGYFNSFIQSSHLKKIMLFDPNGNCLAAATKMRVGCDAIQRQGLMVSLENNYILEKNFYYEVSGKDSKELQAQLFVEYSIHELTEKKNYILFWGLVMVAIVILFLSVIISMSFKTFKNELKSLEDRMYHLLLQNEDVNQKDVRSHFVEMQIIEKMISRIKDRLNLYYKKEKIQSEDRALAQMAQQVAHDIRSPLNALEFVYAQARDVPFENEEIARNAVHRIRNIAQDLLSLNFKKDFKNRESTSVSERLLGVLVNVLIQEKNIQHKDVTIKKTFECEEMIVWKIINARAIELLRILSNLIDNSIQATQKREECFIEIRFENHKPGFVKIIIKDNGKGIRSEYLDKVFDKGFSVGKLQSTGLGLFHAKEILESWGGSIALDSEVGVGTQATLIVPIEQKTEDLAYKMQLHKDSKIVVLDDENYTSAILQKKLSFLNPTILYFKRCQNFYEWLSRQKSTDSFVFLIDQDLNDILTGLEVIQNYNLAHQSMLVTSQYENRSLRENAKKIGCKVLPKDLLNDLTIELFEQNQNDNFEKAILIDDDPLVRKLWRLQAKKNKVTLFDFETYKDFQKNIKSFSKETVIYIDSNLPDGKGENFAEELYKIGFQNIILTTGYIHKMPAQKECIQKIIDKKPPW